MYAQICPVRAAAAVGHLPPPLGQCLDGIDQHYRVCRSGCGWVLSFKVTQVPLSLGKRAACPSLTRVPGPGTAVGQRGPQKGPGTPVRSSLAVDRWVGEGMAGHARLRHGQRYDHHWHGRPGT